MNDYTTPQNKDPQLWQLAQRRASFKGHLAMYLIVISFLWLLWFFSGSNQNGQGFPWPVWPTLGWGIGLAFHYIGAFVHIRQHHVEKEYEKLVNEKRTNQ